MHYNDVIKEEEEILKYVKLNISKLHYVSIDEFKKWLKELREVID